MLTWHTFDRGVINSFGAYQEYYSSDLLRDRSASQISWVGTIQGFLLEVLGIFVGPLFDLGYFHSLIFIGSFLIVLGTMLLSLCTTYWQIVLAQGICIGLGSGLIFVPGVAIVAASFTRRRPIAIGLVASASSVGK